MHLFAIAGGLMAVVHLVAAFDRPRVAVLVSGALWLLYAVYEYHVANGVLCDSDCNIRVDLVLFMPLLILATDCAYKSYIGRPGQALIICSVLGVIGLVVVAVLWL